ncbi:MAG: ubiquinol-cytochrome c reductase iron-sulfur subunit, partial [Candidatus Zixiibacteriota bacterium]
MAVLDSCAGSFYYAKASFENKRITIKKSEFTRIEKDKIVERKFVMVKSHKYGYPICIYKMAEDDYSALLMECTHRGCELEPQGDYLLCPCHGSEFTNRGLVQNAPATDNLKSFKVSADNENIYV